MYYKRNINIFAAVGGTMTLAKRGRTKLRRAEERLEKIKGAREARSNKTRSAKSAKEGRSVEKQERKPQG